MRNLILLTGCFLFSFVCVHINAQTEQAEQEEGFVPKRFVINPDPGFLEEDMQAAFDRNLDSLMNTWYVQEAVNTDSILYISQSEPNYIPVYGDSIYIERISRMQCPFQLTYNNIVRDYIDVYTKRRRAQMEVMLGVSEYYFPIIEEIFDYYCLPLELKYLVVIESAFHPKAVSRAGATGLWQIMLPTGKMYKLEISTFVDERRDPVKSTYAAAAFLRDLYAVYGDWTLAIAAYNCGPGNVNKAIKRAGGKIDYWDIYPYLPKETRGYVPAFIAVMYSFNHHKEHNLSPKYANIPVLTDSVMINKEIHLQQVSEVLDIPLEKLENMNPQYRKNVIPGLSGSYPLRLPSQYATKFIELEDSIASYKKDIYLSHSYKTKTPAEAQKVNVKIPPGSSVTHVVRKGETLGGIAAMYKVKLSDLKAWNGINNNLIQIGQKLKVYNKS